MKSDILESRRILIIDDNEAIHDDFQKILGGKPVHGEIDDVESILFSDSPAAAKVKGLNFELDSATQGEDGCLKVQRAQQEGRPFALAFVDMRMPPGWDGVKTIRHIFEVDSDIQVVVCTAYSDYSWEQMFEKLGMTDRVLVLKKPFDPMEVSQLAAALTEKWKLKRQANLKLSELEAIVHARTHELREQAHTDRLTGMRNRAYVMDRLVPLVKNVRLANEQQFALLFVDFDRFKLVNDTLGHEIGDELLVEIASRIEGSLYEWMSQGRGGSASFCARLGGDEFVVVLDRLTHPRDSEQFASDLLATLAVSYNLKGYDVHSSASVGIALSGPDYARPEEILRDADNAMFRAKGSDKGRFATFDPSMRAALLTRLALENDLRFAIARKEFEIVYQPIIELRNGKLTGFEALLRWHHPTRGLVMPGEFIPLAEEVNLIIPIGKYVIDEVCKQVRRWRDDYPFADRFTANVNLSRKQFRDPDLINFLHRTIKTFSIPPGILNLEVTESTIMEHQQKELEIMRKIDALGVKLNLDDFGTGYSSLSCLHQMPLRCLKIDRSFIVTMTGKREYAAVVSAIIQLAHNLGVSVVAEGVETKEQAFMLKLLDCDYAQGYLFSKPLSQDAAENLIAGRSHLEESMGTKILLKNRT